MEPEIQEFRPAGDYKICRIKGDDDTESINSSRTSNSSSESADGHGAPAVGDQVPLGSSSVEHQRAWYRLFPRSSFGTAVATITLICAVITAINSSYSGSCFGGLLWRDGGGDSRRDETKLKINDGAAMEGFHRSRLHPIRSIIRKLRESKDNRRRRRKLRLEAELTSRGESDGDPGRKSDRMGGGGTKRKEGTGNALVKASGGGGDDERSQRKLPGVLVPHLEATRRGSKQEVGEQTTRGAVSHHRRKGRKNSREAAAATREGREEEEEEEEKGGRGGGGRKRKRRALRALWRGAVGKFGGLGAKGGGVGEGRGATRVREEEAVRRVGLLAELRRRVEERHGRGFWARAKAVDHELNEDLLMRYLEMAYWTMEVMGESLPDAIESTLIWRESARPHFLTDHQVAEEAMYGKMYVRGLDREGRPLIHYRPGLEKTFDTEKGLNLLFYTLERATAMLPKGQTQFAVVADCSGFGPSKSPPLPMLKTAFVTMQRHYPMRLGYVMIVNAGGPIVFVWKLISTVLEDRTKDKIAFLSKKEAEARLTSLIDPSVLPATIPGGQDRFVYSNEAYLSTA